MAPIVLALLGLTVLRERFRKPGGRRLLAHAAVALIAISAISAPFVLAQRAVSPDGWDLRHVTPVGFLTATILVSLAHYLIRSEVWRQRVLLSFVAPSFCSLYKDYLIWQSRGVFDRSVMEHVKDNELLRKADFILVGVNTFFFREIYRIYEWERMLESVYGRQPGWVILGIPPMNDALWEHELPLHGWPGDPVMVNRDGCQVFFQPLPSDEVLELSSSLHCYWLRLTASEQEKSGWLKT